MQFPESIKKWINEILAENQIQLKHYDFDRPWGGFYVIAENTLQQFVEYFFPELLDQIDSNQPWSPKVLFVAPHKKLSWQYHHRRSEVWRVIKGKVAIVRSPDDNEQPQEVFIAGDKIELQCGERHRLIGLDDFGVVAEIWQHTDSENLSDENDIVRVQDDFGR